MGEMSILSQRYHEDPGKILMIALLSYVDKLELQQAVKDREQAIPEKKDLS